MKVRKREDLRKVESIGKKYREQEILWLKSHSIDCEFLNEVKPRQISFVGYLLSEIYKSDFDPDQEVQSNILNANDQVRK